MKLGGIARIASKYAPEILLAIGTAGFAGTIIFTAKRALYIEADTKYVVKHIKEKMTDEKPVKKAVYACKELAPVYLPIVGMSAGTLACFYAAHGINVKRIAEVTSAYSIMANTFDVYKEKVAERLGDSAKDIFVEASDAEGEPVEKESETTIWEGYGDIRVYDRLTGRKFFSTASRIREAEATIAKRLNDEIIIPLNEFYYELGIPDYSMVGDAIGWDATRQGLDIIFRSHVDAEGNPYLVLVYEVCALNTGAFKI